MILHDSHRKVLEAVADYRYLTPAQLQRLGVSRSRAWLWRVLRELEAGERPLLKKLEYGVHPVAGKLPKINCLSAAGATTVAAARGCPPEAIYYPRQLTSRFRSDYFHRTATIDVQIELTRYAEEIGRLAWFAAYFHKRGANRGTAPGGRLQALTRVELPTGAIIPDGLFRLETATGQDWLFALEVKNGYDTAAVLTQLEGHITALESGALSAQFGFPAAHRVLVVFNGYWHGDAFKPADAPMYAAMQALAGQRAWSEFRRFFAFSTVERLQRDITGEWYYVRPSGLIEPGRGGIFDAGR